MEEAFASLLRSIDQHTHQLTTEISPENYLAMSQLPLTYPWSRLVFDFKDLHTACSLLILKIFKPTTSSIGHSDSHFRPRLRRVVPDASPPLLNDMDHADTKHLAGLCDAQPFNSTVSQYCAPGCPVFMPTGYRPSLLVRFGPQNTDFTSPSQSRTGFVLVLPEFSIARTSYSPGCKQFVPPGLVKQFYR